MPRLHSGLVAACALAILTMVGTGPAPAQIPDEFTNLKVLPEDIGKRELVSIMRSFASALGERCHYCHVGEPGGSLEGYDFASDEKETKIVARTMMKMVNDINTKYLPELAREDVIQVRCVTCHHGVEEPETIDNVVMEVIDKDGVDAGLARYRELREEYYGTASYDFSAGPLNNVAERLAQERENVAGAITVMKMNIELNPDQSYSYIFLGRLYQQAGDKDAAIANLEKALELEPDNRWAKNILEKIKAGE